MKGSSVAAVRRVTYDGKASSASLCSSLLLSSAPARPQGGLLRQGTTSAGRASQARMSAALQAQGA